MPLSDMSEELTDYLSWLNSFFQKRDPDYENWPFWKEDIFSAISVWADLFPEKFKSSIEGIRKELRSITKRQYPYHFFQTVEAYTSAVNTGMYWFNINLLRFLADV